MTSDKNKSKRPLFSGVAIADRKYSNGLAGDKLQRDIQNWLSPPDPWKNHHIACESHLEGTAAWFLEGETFSEWKASGQSSLLWMHGKREFRQAPTFSMRSKIFLSRSWRRKECSLVRETSDILSREFMGVGQFHDHSRNRGNAKMRACITRVLLV